MLEAYLNHYISKSLCRYHIREHTYVLNCSAKMRLVDVPVMVMSPPMVAAYVMLSDRHLQIM